MNENNLFVSLLRILISNKINCIPIVATRDSKVIHAFLYKEEIEKWMSDLSRIEQKENTIPSSLLSKDIPKNINEIIENKTSFPIIDIQGKNKGLWNDRQLILAILEFRDQIKTLKELKIPLNIKGNEQENPNNWFMGMILQSFPWSIYASDLTGNTLFHNESFIKEIVDSRFMEYSLEKTEKFLRNLVQDLLVKNVLQEKRGFDIRTKALIDYIEKLHTYVYIINLQEKDEIVGYLYVFQKNVFEGNLEEQLFEKFCHEKQDYDTFMEKIQTTLIEKAMVKNSYNQSTAAKFLQIKRTTLSAMMSRLKIKKPVSNDS